MFELNVHTIMSLIYEVEKQSKIQNKTSETEIDVEDEKLTDSSQIPSPQV